MAYKALYRSYRPQTFEEVAGQEHIVTTLQNAIKENKIAHAYLFAGPRGTGKTTIAKILAKALNCESDNPPCGNCDNCISISEGQHPDVIEIDAASNNGVDEVRDLIDKVKYAPINGKYKVYIIDEVHMMTTGAFNALLKTLEEPPVHAVFILATTEPHKVLPTIISRCQRFDFKKVEDQDIVSRLQYVLDEEKMEYEQQALYTIAKLAEGGMRDALSILEQCLAYNNSLTVAHINEVYGLLSMDNKIHFIKKLLSKDIKGVLELLEQMLSSSIDIKRLTFDLIDILKDIIIYKNTNDLEILFVLAKQDIDAIVPYIAVEEAFHIIDILVEASSHYTQSLNAKTYFELAMLKICNTVEERSIAIKEVVQEKVELQPQVSTVQVEEKIADIEQEPTIQPIEEVKPLKEEVTEQIIIEEQIDNKAFDIKEEDLHIDDKQEEILVSPSNDITISFDDIINILVQANRNILNDIKEKWPVIGRYRYNLNTAKLASMLFDGTPVAAAKGGIIISFEYQPQVNDVNYNLNYHHLRNFLKEILGEEYDFIAVTASSWPSIREKYIQMNREGILPEPKQISLSHIEEYHEPEKQLTDAQKLAIDMFGEDIVEFEEE